MITPNSIKVTDYLTWEYSTDPDIQYLACPAPTAMRDHMPDWFKQLKAYREEIVINATQEPFAEQQTIRNCLGFRGLANIGYTIPLPEELNGYDTYFSRGRLHPGMLSGTQFANQGTRPWCADDLSLYQYRLRLLRWPWRARMAPGWRLLILPYLMDWNPDWTEFAGAVEPNYDIRNGTSIGTSIKWSTPIDTAYNYYNLETVVAFKRATTIAKGTVTFCAVPLYDPELLETRNDLD